MDTRESFRCFELPLGRTCCYVEAPRFLKRRVAEYPHAFAAQNHGMRSRAHFRYRPNGCNQWTRESLASIAFGSSTLSRNSTTLQTGFLLDYAYRKGRFKNSTRSGIQRLDEPVPFPVRTQGTRC